MIGTASFLTCFEFRKRLLSSALSLSYRTTRERSSTRPPKDYGAMGVTGQVLLQPNSMRPIVAPEDTLSEILRMQENDECRIVGIYGAGGVGKDHALEWA